MLGCPLATPSETLWLTTDNEHYWRRFSLAMGLSIGFHALLAAGFIFYFIMNAPAFSVAVNSGSYDLPINVKIITENSLAQKKAELQAVTPKPVLDTIAQSSQKIAQEKIIVDKKPAEQTHDALNSQASTTQKSEVIGMSESITVTSEPRYRVPPQPPEYPAQAQR